MSAPEDPPRWSEGTEVPTALSRMLSGAQHDDASDAELAELRTRLGPVLNAPPPGSGTAALPALAKLAAGTLLAVLGVGSILYLQHRHAESKTEPAAAPPLSNGTLPSALAAPTAPSAALLPSAPEAAPAATTPSASTKQKSLSAFRSPATSDASTAQAEATLLEQARSDLAGNPAQALALTQRHAAEFPHGLLVQEREVIAISALRRLGRSQEADARAARFDARYPKSAHQQVVDSPALR